MPPSLVGRGENGERGYDDKFTADASVDDVEGLWPLAQVTG